MIIILLLCVFFPTSSCFSQLSGSSPFNSPEKIKLFADHLFCSGDYFRASLEYERYLADTHSDTAAFKAGLGYSLTGNYKHAEKLFLKLGQNSSFEVAAQEEYYKLYMYGESYNELISVHESGIHRSSNSLDKIYYSAYVLSDKPLPPEEYYTKLFTGPEAQMLSFYNRKKNPSYKSPLWAGIMSAIIPGAGKFYTGRYGDGVTALISTGTLTYLALDNFRASHRFRGFLFTGLAVLFNAGNIYGSVLSAKEYNLNFKLNTGEELKSWLRDVNYFTVEYEFCK